MTNIFQEYLNKINQFKDSIIIKIKMFSEDISKMQSQMDMVSFISQMK